VHGGPALRAVADEPRDAGAPRGVDQHPGEPERDPGLVHGARQPDDGAAHALLDQVDHVLRVHTSTAGGALVRHGLLGGDLTGDGRCARGHDQGLPGAEQRLAQRPRRGTLLRDGPGEVGEVVAEGQVHHAVGLLRPRPEHVRVGDVAPQHRSPGGLETCGGRVGAGQAQHLVAGGQQLGDDGGPDPARGTGDEHAHDDLQVSRSHRGDATRVPSP
jgi:hypothetical protein